MSYRRKHSGRYGHNTPGDGTGLTTLPEKDYGCDILTDATLAKADGTDTTPGQWYPKQEDHDCKE